MTEQILPILKANSGGAKATVESVVEIGHPKLGEFGSLTRFDPGPIQHPQNAATLTGKNVCVVGAPLKLDDGFGDAIEHHEPFLPVFDLTMKAIMRFRLFQRMLDRAKNARFSSLDNRINDIFLR